MTTAAVENDSLMSGTVRDCLFDDIFVGFSEAPSDGYDYTNHGSVLKVRDVVARFSPSIYDGRTGTGMLFKWDDAAGSVDAVHRISQAIEAIRPVFEIVNGAVAEQTETTSEISDNAATASNFIVSVGESAAEMIQLTADPPNGKLAHA